jgi:dynein heavy chain, axonemal
LHLAYFIKSPTRSLHSGFPNTASTAQEDLKAVLKAAGTGERPVTFLFSDTQIKSESFVEDLSNMLSSGEVPNLFASDERAAINDLMRAHAKRAFGGKRAGQCALA